MDKTYWQKFGVVIIENFAKKVRNWVLYINMNRCVFVKVLMASHTSSMTIDWPFPVFIFPVCLMIEESRFEICSEFSFLEVIKHHESIVREMLFRT